MNDLAMKLDSFIIELLTRCLKDTAKEELCALLLEDSHGKQELIRVSNWSSDPYGFFVSKTELERVERYAECNGQKIIAFIHSHRSSLELSKQDSLSFHHSKYPWIVVNLGHCGLKTRVYEKAR